jgi:hypothetical protein
MPEKINSWDAEAIAKSARNLYDEIEIQFGPVMAREFVLAYFEGGSSK